jgi:hypothetical protein
VDEAFAGKTVEDILALYMIGKVRQVPLDPDPNDPKSWEQIMKMTWEQVKTAARKGKNWAKTVKKELSKKDNWKKDPTRDDR